MIPLAAALLLHVISSVWTGDMMNRWHMLKPKKVNGKNQFNDVEISEEELKGLLSLAEIISNYMVREIEKELNENEW